jgi:hypothetical protein
MTSVPCRPKLRLKKTTEGVVDRVIVRNAFRFLFLDRHRFELPRTPWLNLHQPQPRRPRLP